MTLGGKIAVVTRGSAQLSSAITKEAAIQSGRVIVPGRRQAQLEKAVSVSTETASSIQGDVSKPSGLQAGFAQLGAEHGRSDVPDTSARIGEVERPGTIAEASFDVMFETDVKHRTSRRLDPKPPETLFLPPRRRG